MKQKEFTGATGMPRPSMLNKHCTSKNRRVMWSVSKYPEVLNRTQGIRSSSYCPNALNQNIALLLSLDLK